MESAADIDESFETSNVQLRTFLENHFVANGIMARGTTGELNGGLATLQGFRKSKYGGDLDVHRWGPHPASPFPKIGASPKKM